MSSSIRGKQFAKPHNRVTEFRPRWRLRKHLLAEAITFCFVATGSGAALGNPTAPKVVNGKVVFATKGNTLTITNSNGAIINWGNFSIGAGEITRFNQPSASSQVLNRVTGQDPSVILGELVSNGHVYLINPNGVAFGPGSQVDVAGLVVSTLDISNSNFTSGNLNFTSTGARGAISNAGSINATGAGAKIYLVAPDIENSGVIKAPNGDIVLAAGATVTIFDTQNPSLSVEIAAPAGTAVNLGSIVAHSASIYGATVAQDGVVEATHAVNGPGGSILLQGSSGVSLSVSSITDASNSTGTGGSVRIDAGNASANVSGQVNATGASGGEVAITGHDVRLMGASVDASGAKAGGTVLVGGDSRGANPTLANASNTSIDSSSALKANATAGGSGGKVVVFSEGDTEIAGSISAKGGTASGNGGSVETSGHVLGVTGSVDVSAAHGKGGSWLLDPYDVTIEAAADSGTTGAPNYNATANSAIVSTTTLDAALNGGAAVTISTGSGGAQTGNITVAGAIAVTGISASSLTLSAFNNISISAAITSSAAPLTLNLSPNTGAGAGMAVINSTINLDGGALNSAGKTSLVGASISNAVMAGAQPVQATGNTVLTGVTLNQDLTAQSGAIQITGGLTLQNGHTLNIGGTGSGAQLQWNSTETLGGSGNLIVGGAAGAFDYLNGAGEGGTLTLGSNVHTTFTASAETFGPLTNLGTVAVNASGITVYFSNNNPTDVFSNQGQFDVGLGTANLYGDWTNAGGVINLSGGALNFGGTFTTAALGTINHPVLTNGTATLTGTLNNSGASVDLSSTGPLGGVVLNGTVNGGTLQAVSGSAPVISNSATLNGVTLNQDLMVEQGQLFLVNGLTLQNGHTLNIGGTGSGAQLQWNSTETLGGSGNLIVGGAAGAFDYLNGAGEGGTLTLGSNVHTTFTASAETFGPLTNLGTVSVNASGITVYFSNNNPTDVFSNQGQFDVGLGTANLYGDWTNAGGVINLSGGALNFGGTFTTAALGTINHPVLTNGTATLTGTLNNSGASVDLSSTGPLGGVVLNGTVNGGTLQAVSGSAPVISNSATLNGVTLNQDLMVEQGQLFLVNGLTLQNGHTLNIGGTGSGAQLQWNSTETLGGSGNLIVGGAAGAFDYLNGAGEGGTLTLGSNVHTTFTASAETFGPLTNLGTVAVNASGITVYFSNNNPTDVFSNQGQFDVGLGTANLYGDWTNAGGVINLSGGALNFGGTFTTAALGTINHPVLTNGTATLTGTLNNSGASVDLSSTGPLGGVVLNGTVNGGTLQAVSGSAPVISNSATLNGVTLNQDLMVEQGQLFLVNGLTLQNGHTLNIGGTGSGAQLQWNSTETLGGSGNLIVGGAAGAFDYLNGAGEGGTLTLGSNVHTTFTASAETFGPLTNLGTVAVNASGITVYFSNNNPTDVFSNQGQFDVGLGTANLYGDWTNAGGVINLSGGALNFGGTFTTAALGTINHPVLTNGTATLTGTLNNSGASVDLSSTGPLGGVVLNGTVNGGTLQAVSGSAPVISNSATLNGVTLNQDLMVEQGQLFLVNGLTLQNGHTLNIGGTGSGAQLQWNSTETLGGSGNLIVGGAAGAFDYLNGAGEGGTLTLGSNVHTTFTASAETFGPLTNLGTVAVNASGITVYFSNNNPTDVFSNQGQFDVGLGTANLYGDWTNAGGVINLSGGALNFGGTFTTAALGTINHPVLTNGTATLTGTLNNSGASVDLSSTGPFGGIVLNGTVNGGMLQAVSGSAPVISNSATLNGVTLNQDLMVEQGQLFLVNGLTLQNGHTLNIGGTGSGAQLQWNSTETLGGNGNLIVGGAAGAFDYLNGGGEGGTLTLGSNVHTTFTASAGTLGPLTNLGTVSVNTSGISANFSYGNQTDVFSNQGQFDVGLGTANLNGNWTNAGGVINLSGGALNFGGTFTTAALGTINHPVLTNGTATLTGTLNNSGASVDLSSTGPFGGIVLNGTIASGTLANANSFTTPLQIGSSTFNSVTLNQDVNVLSSLSVTGGLVIANGHVLTIGTSATNAGINFTGTQSVSGNGELVFGGTTYTDYLNANGSGTTVTLAPGITTLVEQNTYFETNVENQTSIIVSAGKNLYQTAPLSNDGIIDIGAGATFNTYGLNFTNPADGIIRGVGTIALGTTYLNGTYVTNTLTNNGTIDPGSGAFGVGTLTISGNLTDTSSSVLHIDLDGTAGTAYDQLHVTGNAALAGTLAIAEQGKTTVGGFFANVGEAFPNMLVATGASSGAFAIFAPPADVTFTTQLSGSPGITNTTQSITRWGTALPGDWTNPANWTRGVPTATTDVFLEQAGLPLITVSAGSQTAQSITAIDPIDVVGGTLTLPSSLTTLTNTISVDGGTLVNNATLNVPGTLNLNSGTLSGTGTIALSGILNKSGTTTALLDETFNNGSGAAVNITGGDLQLAGNGTHSGMFNVASGATLEFASGTQLVTTAGSIAGAGGMLVSGGDITMDGSYSLPNAPVVTGGVLVFHPFGPVALATYTANSGDITWGNVTFTTYNNDGTAVTTFTDPTTLGTVNQAGGTVNFNVAGNNVTTYNLTSGTVNSAGMTSSGIFALTGGIFNVLGGSTFNSTGTVNVTGATFNSAGTSTLSTVGLSSGGVVTGTGNITAANMIWTGTGQVAGTGLLTIDTSLSLPGTVAGPGSQVNRTIDSLGAVTQGGGTPYVVDMSGTAVFNNQGSFTLSNDGSYGGSIGSGGTGVFNNSGTFTKSGGTSSGFYYTTFNNTGTLNANSGTFILPNGGTNTGVLNVGGGDTLLITSTQPTYGTGTVVLGDNTRLTGAGTVTVQGSLTSNATATGVLVAAATSLNLAGATLSGSGPVNNAGTLVLSGSTIDPSVINTGTINVAGSSDIVGPSLSLNGGTINLSAAQTLTLTGTTFNWNAGTLAGNGTLGLTGGANLVIAGSGTRTLNGPSLSLTNFDLPAGELDVTGASSLALAGTTNIASGATLSVIGIGLSNTGQLDNAGTLAITGATVSGGGSINSAGTMNVASSVVAMPVYTSGNLYLTGGTSSFNSGLFETGGLISLSGGNLSGNVSMTGGLLRGTGTITGNVNNSSGTIEPGFSPGEIQIVGNLTMGPGGTLYELIQGSTTPGTDFDVVTVSGVAALDGVLNVVLGNGYIPPNGSQFSYLTYGSTTGNFASITQPSGATFTNTLNAGQAALTAHSSAPPAPPPPAPAPPAPPPAPPAPTPAPSPSPSPAPTPAPTPAPAPGPTSAPAPAPASDQIASDSAIQIAGQIADEPTVVALDQTTSSNYGDSAASGSSGNAVAGADPASTIFNGLLGANGDQGLALDPVHPFIGHPVQVNVCSK